MALNMAYNQRPQYLDVDGNPLSGGRVTFRDIGTPDLKSIYADPEGTVELTNPVLLDAGGFVPESSIFYGEGDYTVEVESLIDPDAVIPDYKPEYVVPKVVGSGSQAVLGNIVYIDAVEDLINLDIGDNLFVNCSQYYNRTVLDQGGGLFKWYPNSTTSTDLGMVFAYSGSPATGRFFRIGDGQTVRTSWYGVANSTGSSMNNRIIQAAAYCNDTRPILEFTESVIEITGTINIDITGVKINSGVRFKQFDTNFIAKIVFNSEYVDVVNVSQSLVDSVTASVNVVFSDPYVQTYPQWWGAIGNGTNDDYTAFYNAAESEAQLIIHKNYRLTATGSVGSTDLSIPSIYLKGSNGIILPSSLDSFTINKCDSDEYAIGNFRATNNDFSNYVVNTDKPKGQWFTSGTMDSTLISTLFPVLTNSYLCWDKRGTYTMTNSGATNITTIHDVKPGVLFKCTTAISIGQFIAGQHQIFTYDSIAPGYVANTVQGSWFGTSKSASDSNNALAITNAINASDDATVDFGGSKLSVSPTATINGADNVIVKNLNIDFNGTGEALTLVDSNIKFIDCKIDSLTSDADCELVIKDTEMKWNSSSYDLNLLGTSIELEGCDLGYTGGSGWTGSIILGSDATKLTTERVLFNNNNLEAGALSVYTGTISNSICDNEFSKQKRKGSDEAATEYLNTVYGGSYTTIRGNYFGAEDPTDTEDRTTYHLSFSGSTEIVKGLIVTDNKCYIDQPAQPLANASDYINFFASGYADLGHGAIVIDNSSNAKHGAGLSNTDFNVSTTSNYGGWFNGTAMIRGFRGIFPYKDNLTTIVATPCETSGNDVTISNISYSGGSFFCTVTNSNSSRDGNVDRAWGMTLSCSRNNLR